MSAVHRKRRRGVKWTEDIFPPAIILTGWIKGRELFVAVSAGWGAASAPYEQ